MSSKRRLRRNGCTGKVRHHTQAGAYIHIRKLMQSGVDEFYTPYKCRFCKGWHIGRPPQKKSLHPHQN